MNEPLIDVNVNLGQWPTRRTPCDELPRLVAKLRQHGVVEAWAGSFDGLFHDDLSSVNARLTEARHSDSGLRLVPFGEINPLKKNWQSELKRCIEVHGMPGIRLHPGYHGYALDHAEVHSLLSAAADARLIVQLVPLMEDERMMHPRLRVLAVDLSPLPDLVEKTPGLRLVLLNASKSLRRDALHRLLDAGDVYIDTAMLEGAGCLETLLQDVSIDRVLLGSHAPSFYFEASTLKLQESRLPDPERRAVAFANARRLLPES